MIGDSSRTGDNHEWDLRVRAQGCPWDHSCHSKQGALATDGVGREVSWLWWGQLYAAGSVLNPTVTGKIEGGKDITFAGPEIFLQQVATGAGAQKGTLCVFAEEGTWLGVLAALVHV